MNKLEIAAEAVEKAVWYPLLMFLSKLFNPPKAFISNYNI
jgi:hypothetical protein